MAQTVADALVNVLERIGAEDMRPIVVAGAAMLGCGTLTASPAMAQSQKRKACADRGRHGNGLTGRLLTDFVNKCLRE